MLYNQIVLEWGRDTETGVWGKGYSPDNGEHFYVTDTTFGRKYRQNDVDGLWNNGMHEKVKEKVNQEITNTVEPAIKQADSAVAYANDAIEKSRVNSQAIVEINSAVSDAVSDAAVARSDGLRAWNAAQSNVDLIDSNYASASAAISSARAEAIAAADEAKASASAAQADASSMKQTLVSAKGDISTLQATATGFKNTLTDAQGNISTLQSDVVGLKKTTSDHAGNIATLQADAKTLISQISDVQGNISTLQQTAEDTDAKITANTTAIEQNKKATALKADQTTVDKTNGTVQKLQVQLKVQADQIATKVSSSDLNAKGYATQTYTQTQIKQASDSWNANLTSVQNSLTDSYTNLHATVDGIQAQVYNKDGSSKITHLSDLIAAKVSSSDLSNLVGKGGRNLVANTGTDIVIDATSDNASDYSFVRLGFTEQPKQGDLITISAESTLTGTGTLDKYQAILYDGYTAKPRSQAQYLKAGKRDSVTLSLDNLDGHGDTFLLIYAGKAGETKGKKNVVHHLMVEKGAIAHDWQPAPEDMQTYTQAQVTLLKNAINLRVTKGDVISQINQEAGGNTLIQVSNGKGSFVLDAANTIMTGKAWIPVAAIADLTADDIKTGTLTGSTVHLDDGNGNTIDLGVLGTDHVGLHSSAKNGDQTYIDSDGIHNYGSSYDTKISQGKITTNLLAVNGGGLIDFRSSGSGITIDSQNIKFYNSNAVNGGIEFSGGSPLATAQDGAVGNELRVRYDRSFALTPIKDESARICASSAAMQVGFIQSGSSTPDRQTTGLWVDGDKRHVNLGVWGADSTWARVEANTHNIHMQADKAHAWLSSDNVFHIYKDGDGSSTATQLKVDGWAWVNGWVEAAGHSQHSALSTKTDIQSVDDDKMLEMINDTDLTTFLYKTDVANGETHRHIGLIIDDVHDVAQYQTPQEFIAPNGVSRDDDNMIGALFGAVKALTKRIKTLESKVG